MERDLEELSENEIILIAQNRNDEAMTYLMEKYKGLVRQKVRTLFLIGGDKDDLVQEGMIGLYKAICDYSPEKEASFRTFADLCISRQVYTAIKTSNRMKNQPLNSYISIYSPAYSDENALADGDFIIDQEIRTSQLNPEEIIIDRENASRIEKNLFAYLSKMETKVLELYLEGMTYQEIASYMDKSPKSIDNALQRIKSKLQKQRDSKKL